MSIVHGDHVRVWLGLAGVNLGPRYSAHLALGVVEHDILGKAKALVLCRHQARRDVRRVTRTWLGLKRERSDAIVVVGIWLCVHERRHLSLNRVEYFRMVQIWGVPSVGRHV